MKKEINYWLKEGKQSKQTRLIKEICKKFKGSDLDKVIQITKWIDNNLNHYENRKVVEKIFATKTAEEIIKDKKHTGCHDTALIFVTLARGCKIPSKYIAGLNKRDSDSGHCVSEVFINNEWTLIDPGKFTISIPGKIPDFYRNYYIMGVGLDSWDIGIKTLKDWYKKTKEIKK